MYCTVLKLRLFLGYVEKSLVFIVLDLKTQKGKHSLKLQLVLGKTQSQIYLKSSECNCNVHSHKERGDIKPPICDWLIDHQKICMHVNTPNNQHYFLININFDQPP